jgi:hypothetical protein
VQDACLSGNQTCTHHVHFKALGFKSTLPSL